MLNMALLKNNQHITMYIKNKRNSNNIKVCSPSELYRKLKNCASKTATNHILTVSGY